MAAKKPARTIAKTTGAKRPAQKTAKMKSEISGSFGKGARHEGTNKSGKRAAPAKPSSKAKEFAGEVVIEAMLTALEKQEILGLIRHTAATGPRDPNDQVVEVKETKSGLRIRTTENHLAVAIGKKVARAHKGGTLTIDWPADDKVARVLWKRA